MGPSTRVIFEFESRLYGFKTKINSKSNSKINSNVTVQRLRYWNKYHILHCLKSHTLRSKYCFWSSCLVRTGLNACMSPTPLSAKSLTTFNHCTFSRASMKDESCSHKLGSFNRNCKEILFNTKSFLLFFVTKWDSSVWKTVFFSRQYFEEDYHNFFFYSYFFSGA